MFSESQGTGGPVRIELATSEIEGGSCRAWADPAQVLGVVATGDPEDTFTRCVQPRLDAFPSPDDLDPPEASGLSDLPVSVRSLFARFQAIHEELYRESKSGSGTARWVEVTCAVAEEDRVYFVKTSPAWICLLRDGKAHPAERRTATGAGDRRALGKEERLHLEVTSLSVLPGDTVVLLTTENEVRPDLSAVSNLFAKTPDLKRASDGLVNLLGIQSHGASAVAMRFLPVGPVATARENPLVSLSAERRPISPTEDSMIEGALDTVFGGSTGPRLQDSNWTDPVGSSVGGSAAFPDHSAAAFTDGGDAGTRGACSSREPAGRSGASPATAPRPHVQPSRGRGFFWPLTLCLLAVAMVLLVAIPEGGVERARELVTGLFPQGTPTTAPMGSLEISPDPPARRVFIDGSEVAAGTPARLAEVAAGKHVVGLDLGPCGIWETEVRVTKGGVARIAPRLTGSVEVVAADPQSGGRVWTRGRGKVSVPAVLDSLPVGWNRIFYEDDRIPMWDRQVLIKAGEKIRVVVPNAFSSDRGQVKVESLALREKEGLVESRGDSVWVDGEFVGTTPFESPLTPGLHSIRVGSGPSYSEVLEIKAGGARHVLAQIAATPLPSLHHIAPGRVLVRGPLVLSVEVLGAVGPLLRPTLHLPEMAPGAREIPLSPVDGETGVFVGVLNPETLPVGADVPYYFTVVGPNGETVWSDLYRIRPEAQWGENDPSPTTAVGEENGRGASREIGTIAADIS